MQETAEYFSMKKYDNLYLMNSFYNSCNGIYTDIRKRQIGRVYS